MALIDILIIVIILIMAWNGWQKGFMLAFSDLVSWVGSFLLAIYLYQYVAQLAERFFVDPEAWLLPISLVITFIIIRFCLGCLSDRILNLIPLKLHTNSLNRVFGVIPGLANGIIYTVCLLTLLTIMPVAVLDNDTGKSRLTDNFIFLAEKLNSRLEPALDKLTPVPADENSDYLKHGESIKLPFTVKNPESRPDLEAKMLVLVNNERKKAGLKLLKADPEIAVVARKYAADMFARGYFSHLTPEGKDPFYRMRKGRIRFLTAGENLAIAPALAVAHSGLMKSPGHRANILHKSFGRLGIGILDGGIHGLMITQNFRN